MIENTMRFLALKQFIMILVHALTLPHTRAQHGGCLESLPF